MKCYGRFFSAVVLVLSGLMLAGCDSGPKFDSDPLDPLANNPTLPAPAGPTDLTTGANLLHIGDSLIFNFIDTPTPVTPIETVIKDDGSVTLLYNQVFVAAGKTVGILQNEIRDRYVPHYFKFLTVTIKTEERFFSVGGQVRSPNRIPYATKMTVLQAINTAGGFTDFADKKRVQIIRADHKTIKVNCIKAIQDPSLDVEIFPGDLIHVPKRIW